MLIQVFMGGKFSRPAVKSHARNQSFFMARVMRLSWSDLRERRRRKAVRPPATTTLATPMNNTLLLPVPELSGGGAVAFVAVCDPVAFSGWVGTVLVGIDVSSTAGARAT